MRVRKAVFPVAGAQVAFLPATKAIPKDLLPIIDRPLIQYAVEEAAAAGIEEFIFIERPGDRLIREHFAADADLEHRTDKRFGAATGDKVRAATLPEGSAHFVPQGHAKGLGHAVMCARDLVGQEPFAVVLPDDLVLGETGLLRQMVDRYPADGGAMIAGIEVIRSAVARYGIMRIDDTGGDLVSVEALVEKPNADLMGSNFAVVGRYILPPEIFPAIEQTLPDRNGSLQLTDAIARMIAPDANGRTSRTRAWGLRFEGERFDCGAPGGVVRATIAAALAREELGRETLSYLRRVLDREDARLRRVERNALRG